MGLPEDGLQLDPKLTLLRPIYVYLAPPVELSTPFRKGKRKFTTVAGKIYLVKIFNFIRLRLLL